MRPKLPVALRLERGRGTLQLFGILRSELERIKGNPGQHHPPLGLRRPLLLWPLAVAVRTSPLVQATAWRSASVLLTSATATALEFRVGVTWAVFPLLITAVQSPPIPCNALILLQRVDSLCNRLFRGSIQAWHQSIDVEE